MVKWYHDPAGPGSMPSPGPGWFCGIRSTGPKKPCRRPRTGVYALSAIRWPCSGRPWALYPLRPGRHRHCRGRSSGPAAGLKPLPSLEESPFQGLEVDKLRLRIKSTYRSCRHAAGPLLHRYATRSLGGCGPLTLHARCVPQPERPARPAIWRTNGFDCYFL